MGGNITVFVYLHSPPNRGITTVNFRRVFSFTGPNSDVLGGKKIRRDFILFRKEWNKYTSTENAEMDVFFPHAIKFFQ